MKWHSMKNKFYEMAFYEKKFYEMAFYEKKFYEMAFYEMVKKNSMI
jgi:hypothetical protein